VHALSSLLAAPAGQYFSNIFLVYSKTHLRLYIRNLTWWFSNHRKNERVRHLVLSMGKCTEPRCCPGHS